MVIGLNVFPSLKNILAPCPAYVREGGRERERDRDRGRESEREWNRAVLRINFAISTLVDGKLRKERLRFGGSFLS